MTNSCWTFKNLLLGLLLIWGVASLVIIIIWAAHPEQKNVPPCEDRLQEVQEKLEGAKVVWGQNKVALEEMVEELRENQTRQQGQIQTLLEHLALSNRSLETCYQEQVVLNGNISLLERQMEQQKEIEANLTAHISLQRDEIEALQENVTQETHQTAACLNLNAAAKSQTLAAQSKTTACHSSKQYLEKQLSRCKEVDLRSSDQRESPSPTTTAATSSSSSSLATVLSLTLPTCWGLHLLLHLLSCSSYPMM